MTKNNVFSKKEMTIEFCHIQVYINIKTNPHVRSNEKLINNTFWYFKWSLNWVTSQVRNYCWILIIKNRLLLSMHLQRPTDCIVSYKPTSRPTRYLAVFRQDP